MPAAFAGAPATATADVAEMVRVRCEAVVNLAFGEDLYLCGSVPALGSWGMDHAVLMKWSEGGRWTAEVAFPCGVTLEMKVVVRRQGATAKWVGAGAKGEDNIILETNLGRRGGRSSRIVTQQPPMQLRVEDIEVGAAEVIAAAQGGAPAAGAAGAAPEAANRPANPADAALALPETVKPAQSPEMQAALAQGRAVTYATTTTTTTYVTIGGDGSTTEQSKLMPQPGNVPLALGPPVEAPGQIAPAQQQPQQQQQSNGQQAQAQGGPSSDRGGQAQNGAANKAVELTAEARAEATADARKCNKGLPRLGCAALAWRKPGASKVRICGSWDAWSREIALEPIPGGGFGVLLALEPGDYEFKYIVDGKWLASEEFDVRGEHGNNVVKVGDSLVLPSKTAALTNGAGESQTKALADGSAEGGA